MNSPERPQPQDDQDILTFSRWLHHVVMVFGGLMLAMVFIVPVLLISAPFIFLIHWLYPPADTYLPLVFIPVGYAVWRFTKWAD